MSEDFNSERLTKLKDKYRSLLIENGLDAVTQSEENIRAGFDTMFEAGWFHPAPREDAWTAYKASKRGYGWITDHLSEEVERAIQLRGGVLPCPVHVGTWPIGYANACAMPTDHGVLILLNEGFISLIYQVVKVFVYSYDWLKIESPWTDPNRTLSENLGWESCGWTRERTLDALNDIFRAYFRDGTATVAPRQQVPRIDTRAVTLSRILHNAERFLVAHEYAHVLLQHCGPRINYATPLGSLREPFERRRQQEVDADELAASLQMALCDLTGAVDGRLEANFSLAGIMLFFACNLFHDVINEGMPGFATRSDPHATHPPANERMKLIFRYLSRFGDEFKVLGNIVLGWALPLSLMLARQFHDRRMQSGEAYPYLTGYYEE